MLAIGPEPLNVVIFATLGICTTTALPVGNRLKAMTSVLRSMMDAFNKLAATVTMSKQSQDPSSTRGPE